MGSLPRADSDWLVRVELDNARISSRISASRSGDSGEALINLIDAADLELCLCFPLFADDVGNSHPWESRPIRPLALASPAAHVILV